MSIYQICRTVDLSTYPAIPLSNDPSIYLPFWSSPYRHPSFNARVKPPINPPSNQSTYLSVCLCVCVSVCLSLCFSVHLSILLRISAYLNGKCHFGAKWHNKTNKCMSVKKKCSFLFLKKLIFYRLIHTFRGNQHNVQWKP